MAASENAFNNLLPTASKHQDFILSVPEHSTVLNILLHTIYDISCTHYSPSLPTIITAVNCLPIYGVLPKTHIVPSTPLYTLLISQAPLDPLEVYALAASFDLYDLAVATSSHLLSFPLSTLSDEMAQRIGSVYLKRLFFLHFGRLDALKRVLLPPPHPHAPTAWCDFTEQKKLTRAWALASAYLAWDARPDLSTSTMESALRPLAEHLTCDQCQSVLRDRIKNLVIQWSVIKVRRFLFSLLQPSAWIYHKSSEQFNSRFSSHMTSLHFYYCLYHQTRTPYTDLIPPKPWHLYRSPIRALPPSGIYTRHLM